MTDCTASTAVVGDHDDRMEEGPKRILFVDDEQNILNALERMLFDYSDDWEMDFIDNGAEALEMMDDEPYDVIVTDMRMPGMDGAELLKRAHKKHPNTARVVLSGHTELEAALRAMPVAHQFLSKPCKAEVLVGVLERAVALQKIVSDPALREVVGDVQALPARPAVFSKVCSLLADEKSSMVELAKVVEQDIAISATVLHTVNTAFFAASVRVATVKDAVTRLGGTVIKGIVLAAEVAESFKAPPGCKLDLDAIHKHSVQVANLASALVSDRKIREDAFLGGLLHDLGVLILASRMPEYVTEADRVARAEGLPLHEVELRTHKATHAEIGAYLLGLWGMPYPVMDAVAQHHNPAMLAGRGMDPSVAVHLADRALHDIGVPGPGGVFTSITTAELEALGVSITAGELHDKAQQIVGQAA